MSDPYVPRRSYEDLDEKERRAVNSLRRLAEQWPDTIGLFSWAGSLVVVDRRPVVLDAIGAAARMGLGEVRLIDNIDRFDIPNDGGDPNEFE